MSVPDREPSHSQQNLAQVPFQVPLQDFPVILRVSIMRTLGISAIVLAVGLASLSIVFIGLAHDNGWSGGSTCSMAESLCRRPSLMAIPVFATMAWGLMLMMLTDR